MSSRFVLLIVISALTLGAAPVRVDVSGPPSALNNLIADPQQPVPGTMIEGVTVVGPDALQFRAETEEQAIAFDQALTIAFVDRD